MVSPYARVIDWVPGVAVPPIALEKYAAAATAVMVPVSTLVSTAVDSAATCSPPGDKSTSKCE